MLVWKRKLESLGKKCTGGRGARIMNTREELEVGQSLPKLRGAMPGHGRRRLSSISLILKKRLKHTCDYAVITLLRAFRVILYCYRPFFWR